jgi:putative GTP pyrophosphokinase
MPEVDARVGANTIEQVLADFDRRKEDLTKLKNATELLVRTILEEEEMPFQSVQARIKERDKLRTKYCNPDKDYKNLDEMPDVVGLRIITYYSDKLDQIAEIISREFAQCGAREDKRIGRPDTFGYSAIHIDCMHLAARVGRTEYRRFAGMRFEIQITTILGHAWAEMHHPWYDEFNSPSEELRRFHRLAAVLELAEQEFLEIRKKKEDRERIASVRVAAKAPEIPVTVDSLNAFLDENAADIAALDLKVAAVLFGAKPLQPISNTGPLAKIVSGAGISTIQQLDDKLRIGKEAVVEFAKQSAPIYDACRLPAGKTYGRGISLLHLAYLVAGAGGKDQFTAAYEAGGLAFLPGFDLELILDVAKGVAATFKLIS